MYEMFIMDIENQLDAELSKRGSLWKVLSLWRLLFGNVKIMVDRDTGRPRGFGFVTFADQRAMEDAISEMHERELDGRVISVNKAQPKLGGSDDPGYGGYRDSGYLGGGRGGYGSGDGDRFAGGRSECFKCGRPGHWARECPSSGGSGGGGRFPSRPRFSGGRGANDHGDRYGGDRYVDRFIDSRYDGGSGGRYNDQDRLDSRYSDVGGRDRYAGDRYMPTGDRFPNDRYGGSDRYPMNGGYGRERTGGFDRNGGGIRGGDRYGAADGPPPRYDGGRYRDRPGPYDRPSRGGRPSSYERY